MISTRRIQSTSSPTKASPRGRRSSAPVAFSGEFLWINHDVDHMKAAPNRHEVFSHVQGRYRPWKKKNSLKSNESTTTLRLISKPDREKDEDTIHVMPPSPASLVSLGNSDPFAALSIAIGPEENELIGFYRDYYLPAQYGDMQIHIGKLWQKDWQDCMEGMSDEGIAHGSLARWGHMVVPFSPRLYAMAMKHQLKATRSLRQKLANGQDLQSHKTYMHLNMLYSAETISRNVAGARVHGRMFKKMFEEAWLRGTLDYTLLLYQVHNDVQTSTISLLPTVFDLDHFVLKVIEPLQESCIDHLPAVDSDTINSTLNAAVLDPLAGFFKSLRGYWATLSELDKQSNTIAPLQLATLGGFEDCIYVGQAVNHYVHIKEQLKRQWNRATTVILLTQAFLSLGALYMAKSLNVDHRTLGRPTFDMRPVVLPALRECLEDFTTLATDREHERFATARVWALYVGALSEHQFPSPERNPRRRYFTAQLAKEAQELGLTSWSKLLPVLQTFIYSERIGPSGQVWFNQLIDQGKLDELQPHSST